MVVLRSAVVYEAMHQKKRVYMKVAHPEPDNKERLKREAEFLQGVALSKKTVPGMPTLLPAYANTTVKADAYGKTMLQGHLLYFYLFEYAEGDTLREVLVKNPQLWINHVGWIMEDVATVVNFLHRQGVFHYGLSPDSILVHFDEKENLPKVLLLDLGIVSSKSTLSRDWYAFAVPPAYTAPELASSNGAGPRADYRTDVYGLGLTLYEMLVGEPAYTYKLRSDKDVYRSVLESRRVAMNRVEDVEAIARIAVQAEAAAAAIDQARAEVASAHADLERTSLDLDRKSKLASNAYASRQALDNAKADKRKAAAALNAARAGLASATANVAVIEAQRREAEQLLPGLETALAQAERDLSFAVVRAPVAGVVGNRAVEVGQLVQPGTRLAAIVPLDAVHIDANFKET
ncbi:MAG: protein kinase, partial [Caldilineaceae bacterium]|nr:protein kinase [Caldilineaceae bacterium]